jgi:hypothetical protein
MDWELEELATRVLERVDAHLPVSPDVVALRLGLTVVDGGRGCEGLLLDELGQIVVDDTQRPERRAFAIAHELGHYLLRRHGQSDGECAANYVGAALLLPRDELERDLRRYGWDLLRLQARHRWASFEAIARRIVSLRHARAFVFDKPLEGQCRPSWYSVPWGLAPLHVEREAARLAAEAGAPVELYGGLSAWPVSERAWHRVITLADLEVAHRSD